MTRARQLRKNATRHERILWRHLRNRQFQGWKFRRQHPVDRYTIDFYCPEARLAIELDGGGHNFMRREVLDQERTRFLASENIVVLRFWNHQVSQELDGVLETIWSALAQRRNPHLKSSPFAKGRGERSPEASRQKIGRHHRQLRAGLIRLSPRGEDEGEGESGSEA